jgi:hypothetical protein
MRSNDKTDSHVDEPISRHFAAIRDTGGLQRTNLHSMVVEWAVANRQQA